MHRLVEAVSRRSAGIAAGVILTGGLAGGVLLTPGTAYATVVASTSTGVTASVFHGNIHVSVTVTNTTGGQPGGTPTGSVSVTGAGGGCTANLTAAGTGSCNIWNVPPGTYTLTASYPGVPNEFASSSGQTSATIAGPPANTLSWTADSPSLRAQAGQWYSYTFQATGSPGIRYSLNGGFSGMSINPFTGTVSGTVPNFGNSFSYSVTATNGFGQSITTSWYTVYVRHFVFNRSRLSTSLSCTSPVFTGTRGRCTLWVTNNGNGNASNVNAQIALPRQLQANFCGYFFFNSFGCSISGNTASQNLGTLYPGQTKSLTVTFTARTGFWLWGWHHGFKFTVKVVGSASSGNGFPFFQNGQSTSVAFVTIIPRGWWV